MSNTNNKTNKPCSENIDQQLLFAKITIDQNQNPIYWFDKNARIVYINQAAWKILGYTYDELINMPVYELNDDMTFETWSSAWNSIKEKKSAIQETYHVCKDGTRIPVEIRALYLVHCNEEYVFAYVTDISTRKSAEDKVKYRQRFEGFLLEISSRFINIRNDEIDIYINRAIKEVCEFTDSDTAQIYWFSDDRDKLIRRYYHYSERMEMGKDVFSEFPLDSNKSYFKEIIDRGYIQINEIQKLDFNNPIRQICESKGIHSFVEVGLFYQKEFIGNFGLSSKVPNRKWDMDEIRMLQLVGDIFVSAVLRKKSVKNILETEQTYREIYNATSEAIFIFNTSNNQIEDVNESLLKLYGLSYELALSRSLTDLIVESPGLSGEDLYKLFQRGSKNKIEIECLSQKSDKSLFWSELSLKTALIHGQNRIIAVVRDISERKKGEQLLRESEEKYRMIIEGQNDLIVKIDTEGRFLFVSPSYCKMFGKTDEEFIGKAFMSLVHEDDQTSTELAMEKLYKPPYVCYLEQRAKTKDGWRWLAWNDNSILDDNNKVIEIIGIGRDITYQKMVENALRESEERFRSIVQNLSDVVFLLDENANIKYVTPSCEEYLGLRIEELLSKKITDFIHPDDVWLTNDNIQIHLGGKDYSIPYEIRIKHTSNTWKMFEVKSQSLLKHPAVKSIIYTISDVTERKLMEKQVLDAIIKTEEKERERFARDLHDDLGPLLSSIKLYIGMLGKTADLEKTEFIISNLQDIVKEAIATTKEVSNDLNPHVLNNYGLISALELFVGKMSSEVGIDFFQNLNDTRYSPAIELSLYRISKELINNTIKHASADKIILRITEKDTKLILNYEDDGRGLPPKVLNANKGGMGLSNIISRAKSLNANYNFYPEHKGGFKFDISVPLIQE